MRRVKPIDSWGLPVTITRLDTGAGCSLLSKDVFEAMSTSMYPIRQRGCDMHGVGNSTLPTIGDLVCDVTVAGRSYPIDNGCVYPE